MDSIKRAQTNRLIATRSDSASFPLTITRMDGTVFFPDAEEGEKVTFTVRKGPKTEENSVLIQKNVTGTRIELEPEDTREMEYGSYMFDVEVVWMENNELETTTLIIGQFCVMPEVT